MIQVSSSKDTSILKFEFRWRLDEDKYFTILTSNLVHMSPAIFTLLIKHAAIK